MDLGINIIEAEEKKGKFRKIIKIILIVLMFAILIGLAYYFLYYKKDVPKEVNLVDEYFINYTAKNVEHFEDAILNNNNYTGDNNAGGLFYESDLITVDDLDSDIIVLSTISHMMDCYKINPNNNGCGISINSNTSKYFTSKENLQLYVDLLYGPNILLEDHGSLIQYGNIKNLSFVNNKYLFEYDNNITKQTINKYQYQVINKDVNDENKILITKAVAFFEEKNENGQTIIDSYKLDNKIDKLTSFPVTDANQNINDYLLSTSTIPKYLFTFTRHPNDGRYIFYSVERLKS